MSEYIPIYRYAKEKNTSVQNVYRWIRERKITDIKEEQVTVTRLRVNRETVIPQKTNAT
jgi:hypothetical protein